MPDPKKKAQFSRLSIDTGMVIWSFHKGPKFELFADPGGTSAAPSFQVRHSGGQSNGGQDAFEYIAVCPLTDHSGVGVTESGTWTGPVRPDFARAQADVQAHEHSSSAYVCSYRDDVGIGPVTP
jgi:hypothetical protein